MLTSDTDNTFLSGLLIGLFISFMYVFPIYLRNIYLYSTISLYGVMVAQAWIYTSHCKEDPRWLKSTVSSVLCVIIPLSLIKPVELPLTPFQATRNPSYSVHGHPNISLCYSRIRQTRYHFSASDSSRSANSWRRSGLMKLVCFCNTAETTNTA